MGGLTPEMRLLCSTILSIFFFASALEHAGLAVVLSASEPAGTGLEILRLSLTTHDVLWGW